MISVHSILGQLTGQCVQWVNQQYMHSNLTLQNFCVKIFSLGIHQIYLHKYLVYEYFHAQIIHIYDKHNPYCLCLS